MLGKLVLCTVLCLFLNEVCLAQTSNTQYAQVAFLQSETELQTRASSECKAHLWKIAQGVFDIALMSALVILSPVISIVAPILCMLTSGLEFFQCAPKFLIGAEIVYSGIFKQIPDVAIYVLKEIRGLSSDCASGNLVNLLTSA